MSSHGRDSTSTDVVVVGAGTAGCTVAARLAGDHGLTVTLVERGDVSQERPPVDPFPAIAAGCGIERVAIADVPGSVAAGTWAAARVGGGGAVNGMLTERPRPVDFEAWADVHGCGDWTWSNVSADVDAATRSMPTMPAPLGPVGAALMRAEPHARPASLSLRLDATGTLCRVSGVDLVADAMADGRVRLLGATAEALDVDERGVTVVTDRGPVRGRAVVLCAGTLRTPALLATAGTTSRRLGGGLMNHLGVMLAVDRGPGGAGGGVPPVTAVCDIDADGHADTADGEGGRIGQVIAFEHIDASRRWSGVAAVLLRTRSRGRLESRDGTVSVRMDVADDDIRSLTAVVRRALAVAASDAVAGIGRVMPEDAAAVPTLLGASDPELEAWVRGNVWHVSHAVGTCAMGPDGTESVTDQRGRVRGHESLWVADASLMPGIVGVHPQLTVAAVAHRIAGFVAGSLA